MQNIGFTVSLTVTTVTPPLLCQKFHDCAYTHCPHTWEFSAWNSPKTNEWCTHLVVQCPVVLEGASGPRQYTSWVSYSLTPAHEKLLNLHWHMIMCVATSYQEKNPAWPGLPQLGLGHCPPPDLLFVHENRCDCTKTNVNNLVPLTRLLQGKVSTPMANFRRISRNVILPEV